MKLRGHEIAIGALAATAFWVLIFVLTSNTASHYEVCEVTKEGAKECANYNIISFALRKIGATIEIFGALITAIATVFIARFTFTLKRSTDRLWEAATAQTDIARKALTDIERPYLFIFNVSLLTIEDFYDFDEDETGYTLKVTYEVANHGKIPAIIENLRSNLSVFTDPLDPLAADYNHPLVIAPVLAAGEKRADIPVDIGWNDMGTNEYGNTVPNFGGQTLFLRVAIAYRGPFTRGHETSIGLRYDERTHRFVEFHTGEKYNYQT
jgi:hypothetical protein